MAYLVHLHMGAFVPFLNFCGLLFLPHIPKEELDCLKPTAPGFHTTAPNDGAALEPSEFSPSAL